MCARARAPTSTHFAPMPNRVWRSRMVLLATAAPRMGDGLAIFSLLAASARRPAPSISRSMAMLASEEKLEARSFLTSALLCNPRVFVTNGLATSGSHVALAQAQVATLAVARLCRRCHLLHHHASLEWQSADPIPTLRATRPSNEDAARHICSTGRTSRQCPGRRKARRRPRGVNAETPFGRLGGNVIGLSVRGFVSRCGTFFAEPEFVGVGCDRPHGPSHRSLLVAAAARASTFASGEGGRNSWRSDIW